jgi:hypothetical protein
MQNNTEREPNLHLAHEVLTVYKATDPEVPLGGLPIRDYEVIRHALAEVPDPTPDFLYDAAWVDIEYMMAAIRGATNPDTEEPFTPKEINSTTESARSRLRAIIKDESAPAALRADARVLLASIPIHEEVARGRRIGVIGKFHVPYLTTLQEASLELLATATSDDDHTLHRMLLLLAMSDSSYTTGWTLPAAPRQPWDATRHALTRSYPDLPISIDGESTPSIIGLPSDTLGEGLWSDPRPHAALRHYAEYPVQLKYNSTGVQIGSPTQRAKFKDELAAIEELHERIKNEINARGRIFARRPADEVAKITSRERPVVREVSTHTIWYLTEFDGTTLDDDFIRQLEQFNRLRIESGLLPEERRVFGWMLLDHARLLATSGQAEAARHQFGTAIKRLEGTVRAFEHADRLGDAFDAVLGAQAAVAYRGLYTSPDAYALRRNVQTYLNNIATVFKDADAAKVHADQAAILQFAIDRAGLCLLQAAADPELRHLIVPASPRTSDQHDALAYPLLYSDKASRYDLTAPVAIAFVDGNEITPGNKIVHVGREILTLPDDPRGLHAELHGLIAGSTKSTKGAKKVAVTKKKPGKAQTTAGSRSDAVRSLSEQLAYAISDADAWAA